jgi:hypothetical protein
MSEQSKWQPIETAPTNVRVLCGRWDIWMDRQEWRVSDGAVFESWFFGLLKKRTYHGREYSHWQPLPPPPATGA